MKTLQQEKAIYYRNKMVTYVNWDSYNVNTGTIRVKINNSETFNTVACIELYQN